MLNIYICLYLALFFKAKLELTWKLGIPRPDGKGDSAGNGREKANPTSQQVLGVILTLILILYFF